MTEKTTTLNRPAAAEAGNGAPTLSDRVRSLRLPDQPSAKADPYAWAPWVLCLLLAAATGVLAYQNFAAAPSPELLKQLQEQANHGDPKSLPSVVSLGSTNVAQATGDIALEAKGYVVPIQQVQVSPKVGGTVLKLFIKEGDNVKEGAKLAEIETTEYLKDYNRTKGMHDAAVHRWQELWKYRNDETSQVKAELEDAKAKRNQLFLEFKRAAALRNTNALAERDYEQAQFSYQSLDQRVKRLELAHELMNKGPRDERIASAKAEMEQAQAEMEKAKWKLDNCTVLAPISGTILSKKTEEGNQVNPAAFSNGLSASLCDMADLSKLEVDLAIAERDVAKVFVGQKCVVKAEAYPSRLYKGTVSRKMPIADRGKASVPVRVLIDIPQEEAGRYLLPEMGAIVTFLSKK